MHLLVVVSSKPTVYLAVSPLLLECILLKVRNNTYTDLKMRFRIRTYKFHGLYHLKRYPYILPDLLSLLLLSHKLCLTHQSRHCTGIVIPGSLFLWCLALALNAFLSFLGKVVDTLRRSRCIIQSRLHNFCILS